MPITNFIYFSFFPGILLVAVTSLASAQVRPPNYSPDAIPETSFTCEDKITGGYYADQEADCQLFHVCVQVSEYEVGPIFLTKVIGSWIRLDIFIRLDKSWCFCRFTKGQLNSELIYEVMVSPKMQT